MRTMIFCALLALGACDRDQPPAPSAAQADQLNEAEDLLNGIDVPDADATRAAPEGAALANSQ